MRKKVSKNKQKQNNLCYEFDGFKVDALAMMLNTSNLKYSVDNSEQKKNNTSLAGIARNTLQAHANKQQTMYLVMSSACKTVYAIYSIRKTAHKFMSA